MTGIDKAAVLALSLPSDQARTLLSRLGDDELERVLAAVARLDEVPEPVQEKVLAEFRASLRAATEIAHKPQNRNPKARHKTPQPIRAHS